MFAEALMLRNGISPTSTRRQSAGGYRAHQLAWGGMRRCRSTRRMQEGRA